MAEDDKDASKKWNVSSVASEKPNALVTTLDGHEGRNDCSTNRITCKAALEGRSWITNPKDDFFVWSEHVSPFCEEKEWKTNARDELD